MIYKVISKSNTRILVWVDDLIFPPDDFDGSFSEPAMSEEWIVAYINGSVPEPPVYAQRLLAIKTFCEKRGFTFYMTNFCVEENELVSLRDKGALFLVDVGDKFEENELVKNIAGWVFSDKYKLTDRNCKFLTRAVGQFADLRCAAKKNGIKLHWWPEVEHCITMEPTDIKDKLVQWVDILFSHRDELISDAIEFYSRPWTDECANPWPHGNEDDDTYPHRKKLAEWLGADGVDIDSYKALLIYSSDPLKQCIDNKIKDGYTKYWGYTINGLVLKAFFKKLEVSVSIDDSCEYGLPMNPGISFLLGICCLAKKLNKNVPHLEWKVRKGNGKKFPYIHTINITTLKETGGLREALKNKSTDGHIGELRKLIECSTRGKVELIYGDGITPVWGEVFGGLIEDIVEFECPDDDAHIVQLEWFSKHGQC